MALFIWTDLLATGNEQVDEDHRELVGKVNGVLESIARREPGASLGLALTELTAFTREHFQREEDAMTLSGYPHLEEHSAEHAHLLSQLGSVAERLKSGDSVDSMEIYNLLTRWLIDHIVNFDKKVA